MERVGKQDDDPDKLISFRLTEVVRRDSEWISDQKKVLLSYALEEAVCVYQAKYQYIFDDAYIQRRQHHGSDHW